MSEVIVSQENFDSEVLQSKIPVLVDFWGPGCVPCIKQDPILHEISHELSGKVKIAKLNVAEHGAVASRFGVMSLPTLILFKDGVVRDQMLGMQQKGTLLAKLASV